MSVKPPVEMLRDISYDPETGVFTRLKSAGNARCGDRADRINTQGRMRIWWGNSIYSAHRVAWFICHGEWPDMWIDHINGDAMDKLASNATGGLTARQRDLLLYIRKYIGEHGIAPSFDEMKAAQGLASKSGIHRMISGLEERGFITRMPDRARAIRLAVPS